LSASGAQKNFDSKYFLLALSARQGAFKKISFVRANGYGIKCKSPSFLSKCIIFDECHWGIVQNALDFGHEKKCRYEITFFTTSFPHPVFVWFYRKILFTRGG
jgi:hypothetical protein